MAQSKPVSRQNHYVPEWYQKGFAAQGPFNVFLDLSPARTRPDGSEIPRVPKVRSPKSCFWDKDLYVTRFGEELNDEIETVLFAGIDDRGSEAVKAFIAGDHARMHNAYTAFFSYMGAQKLRTPKGLDWIRSRYPALSQVELMTELQHLRHLYGTMWAEAVREIVSAEDSHVKFIVTDHPVTTFNPAWPLQSLASGTAGPPVDLNGTQTIFALDANHCLILTHLPYATDPAGTALGLRRENARSFAPTLIRTDALIRSRRLNPDGVTAINHVLKASARRYVAAASEDWLYPEKTGVLDGERLARLLLPPKDELWHFGGEIYIGYKDGGVGYQDAFGRTSRAQEAIAKPAPASEPDDSLLCPCGNGRHYVDCCKMRPLAERPPWTMLGLRERNVTLVRAVIGILGMDSGKSWEDVRRELSGDQIARMHNVVRTLWPEDTDLASLLPRPEAGRSRAVYMGPSDPRTVSKSVVALVPLFDEIFVLNPFLNPVHLQPKYSPIESPGAHKRQSLKNILFLLMLAPLIEAGKVVLFPDPGDFSAGFQMAMRKMAEARTANWKAGEAHMAELESLQRDDLDRALSDLPDDALRSLAQRKNPDANARDLDGFVRAVRSQQQADPLALLQALPVGEEGAQYSVMRCVNLELGLFIAQLTGAVIVTDLLALWEHLHLHTRAASPDALQRSARPLARVAATTDLDTERALRAWTTPGAATARLALRDMLEAAAMTGADADYDSMVSRLNKSLQQMLDGKHHATGQETVHAFELELSIPENGFESPAVQRLMVGFGRDDTPTSVRLALYRPWN